MTGTAGLRPGGQRAGHWPHGQTSSWGPSPKTEEWELSIYSRKIGEICFVSGKGLKCLRHWAALGRIWGCAVCVAQARGLSPLGVERECRCRGVRAQQPPLEAPPSGVPLGLSLWTWLGDMMRDPSPSPSPMPVLRLSGPVEGDPGGLSRSCRGAPSVDGCLPWFRGGAGGLFWAGLDSRSASSGSTLAHVAIAHTSPCRKRSF